MGIFGRSKNETPEDNLPPVPEDEIGEVQNLAKLIWDFENHDVSWETVRQMHEAGDSKVATQLYRDRIAISNHILERYQPREG